MQKISGSDLKYYRQVAGLLKSLRTAGSRGHFAARFNAATNQQEVVAQQGASQEIAFTVSFLPKPSDLEFILCSSNYHVETIIETLVTALQNAYDARD